MRNFFFGTTTEMGVFSPFHFIFFAFGAALTAIMIIFFKKCKPLTLKIIIGIFWLICVGFEIGKQINYGYPFIGGPNPTFKGIRISALPFQFCSLPYIVWPLLIFLPKSKFKDVLNMFAATFMLFPAIGCYFYPSSLGTRVYINHQTMIHHINMGIVGALVFTNEYKNFSFKKFLICIGMFLALAGSAIALNVHVVTVADTAVDYWNLNPLPGYYTTLGIYRSVIDSMGYGVFLAIFLAGFIGFATLTYYGMLLVIKLYLKVKENKNSKVKEA